MSKVIFGTKASLPLIERIKGLEIDTCVIVGAHDYNTGVGMSYRITRQLKNGKLVIFENSGHFQISRRWIKSVKRLLSFGTKGDIKVEPN